MKLIFLLFYLFATPLFACNELNTLALNIYHEARGQGIIAMVAVGEVTLNRVESPEFPDNICDVVYQKNQFSWVGNSKPPSEIDQWNLSKTIAIVLMEYKTNITKDSLYFLNLDQIGTTPKWARKLIKTTVIGDHTFYSIRKDSYGI